MKRKNLMTALLCAVCLAVVPMAGCGEQKAETKKEAEVKEETAEETTEEAETETAEETVEEAETETAEEATEETEAETAEVPAERPAYVASEYVELGEYKGLTVELQAGKYDVTDEMVEDRFASNVENFGTAVMDVFTEGTVQEGDLANIDYVGKKDDVAFDGGTAEGYDLKIGSGSFIDGFEEGLVGVEIGSTVDLELTFPEAYHSAELAGQDVVFTVTVNEVKRGPEEITDEVISKGTSEKYTTVEAYKEYVRSILEEDAENARQSEILSGIVTQVVANASVKGCPQDLVDYNVNSMKEYYEQTAAMYGMELEAFLEAAMGTTVEEFEKEARIAVENSVAQEMCLAAVGEAEKLEVTDEEFKEGVANYMSMYGYADEAAFLTAVGGENVVRLNLMQEKVTKFLVENANVVEVENNEATEEVLVEAKEETTEEAAEEAE